MADLYPGATWHPSVINHPMRQVTWGITIHWTVGSYAGDIQTLDGPSVDCHFYVAKSGEVVQFLDPDSMAWTAKATANATCLQIETEGRGEAWTDAQLRSVAKLCAWLCHRYGIPVRHVDPRPNESGTFRGIFGHRDLSNYPAVDHNDHYDTVPDGTGWSRFLVEVQRYYGGEEPFIVPDPKPPAPVPPGTYRCSPDTWEETNGPTQGIKLRARAIAQNFGPVLAEHDRAAAERMVTAVLEIATTAQYVQNVLDKSND